MLKTRLKDILITSILFALVFAAIFFLTDLDFTIYFQAIELTIVFLLIYIVLVYIAYRKREDELKVLREKEEELNLLKLEHRQQSMELESYLLMWLHQVKTPITAAKLLCKEDFKLKKELLNIENYTNMVLNYLKIAKKDTDMHIKSVEIDDILKPILKKYAILFISNKITLHYEGIKELVVTDEKWASALIEQFISNAVKYTYEGEIYFSFDKEKKALCIKDTGIGIRESDLPKIFDRGFSGFNGSSKEESTGIGLFLAKKISTKLNIEIEVESVFKQGSEFRIYFP